MVGKPPSKMVITWGCSNALGLPHEITISKCQSLLITTIIPPFILDFPIRSMMLSPCGCEPQQAAPVQETADEPEDLIAPEPLVRKMLQGGVNWCCNYQVGGCQNTGRGRHIVQTCLNQSGKHQWWLQAAGMNKALETMRWICMCHLSCSCSYNH